MQKVLQTHDNPQPPLCVIQNDTEQITRTESSVVSNKNIQNIKDSNSSAFSSGERIVYNVDQCWCALR